MLDSGLTDVKLRSAYLQLHANSKLLGLQRHHGVRKRLHVRVPHLQKHAHGVDGPKRLQMDIKQLIALCTPELFAVMPQLLVI